LRLSLARYEAGLSAFITEIQLDGINPVVSD